MERINQIIAVLLPELWFASHLPARVRDRLPGGTKYVPTDGLLCTVVLYEDGKTVPLPDWLAVQEGGKN